VSNPDLATRLSADGKTHGAIVVEPPVIESGCGESGAYELCEAGIPIEPLSIPSSPAHSRDDRPAEIGVITTEFDAEDTAELVDEAPAPPVPSELRGWPRFEAWVERLAHKYKFIRKITSRLYLPIAFHSGLTMKKLDPHTFTYVLPFRRFNRNFYDAMAGAALVANSEIAAGMYLFGELGGKWTVVCKHISYRFLRPCLGPAIYKVNSLDDVKAKLQAGLEFNIDLTLEILQQVSGRRKHPRVGRCEVTFHCTPKGPEGNRGLSRRRRRRLLK